MEDGSRTQGGMTMTTQHTPTPWTARGERIVADRPIGFGGYNEDDILSLARSPEVRRANAAFIVLACNAHEQLVEALRKAEHGANEA